MSNIPQEEKYISVTVTLPEDYVEFLDKVQSEDDMNRSQVVRAAIRELKSKREQAKKEG